MTFCSRCGGATSRRVPAGEDRPRVVCDACGAIHYENPRLVVGAVVARGDEVLLCRRAIEPRRGFWTVPAGFLELGESAAEGARRETREETGVEVRVVAPLVCFDILRIGQIYMIFAAEPTREDGLGVGTEAESLEVRWFTWAEVPWDELAFDATRLALERAREDRERGEARVHFGALVPRDGQAGPWRTSTLVDAWSVPLGAGSPAPLAPGAGSAGPGVS